MKKLTLGLNLISKLTALVICLYSLTAVNSQAQTVVTISSGEYPPWTGVALKHGGFVNHVISEAFKRQGYQVKFSYFPWKRAFESAKKGQFAATSYWYKSAERALDFYYSEPVSSEKLVFFHLKVKKIAHWKSFDDLKDYQIGVTRGYTYTEEFWLAANEKRINVQMVTSDLQNFRKLIKGRIDLVPTTLFNGYNLISNEFDPSLAPIFTFHPKVIAETQGHLLFSKKHPQAEKLVAAFNRGLAQLKEEGLYRKFFDDLLTGKYSN
ncbi:MAG: hypothetical protein OFPI_14010 [Osedax symbiont Rs2]|nr:MAG: hypothetical protein OFPI_14010 [Osedax symbiont Rs2]